MGIGEMFPGEFEGMMISLGVMLMMILSGGRRGVVASL